MVPHERIGRYEVLRKIATGGMAELFLAKQVGMEGFEKVVAIKRILAHLAFDEEFINMFRDEARIVAKLSHPNIVQIYDLGKSDDTYFIAMEYIPGRNLSSVAKKAKGKGVPLPPEYIARCIAQACEGLYYAHTRQDIDGKPLRIVHRDVSPQNIILAFSGGVKLVDFGIAKAATKIAHTRAGVLKGKYAYMSPEQIRGDEVDARSDLFAVGIVLYELLCGRRPFEKENSIQTLKAIVQEPHLDCRVLNSDIPDGLAAIIDKALAKSYHERWTSAQELQLALEDFVASTGKRCNNIAISKWVTELFAEELSRDRGGTMVLKGVGEIILPDLEDKADSGDGSGLEMEGSGLEEPSSSLEADSGSVEPAVSESRARGGGSLSFVAPRMAPPQVNPRPPIQAPSVSLHADLLDNSQSGPAPSGDISAPSVPAVPRRNSSKAKSVSRNGREMLIEEGVIERGGSKPTKEKWSDDQTARGESTAGKGDSESAVRVVSPSGEFDRPIEEGVREGPPPKPSVFDDSRTEFAPEGLSPPEDPEPQGSGGEDTWTPMPKSPEEAVRRGLPTQPLVEDVSGQESALAPEDSSEHSHADEDIWNEATIGYPDGLPPALTDGPVEELSQISLPTGEEIPRDAAATISPEPSPRTKSKVEKKAPSMSSWTGLANERFTQPDRPPQGEEDLWDDKTTTNDAYQADDSVPAPVVRDVDGPSSLDVADTGSMHAAEPTMNSGILGEVDPAEFSGEHTVALGSLVQSSGPTTSEFSDEISVELGPSASEPESESARTLDGRGRGPAATAEDERPRDIEVTSRPDSDTDLGPESAVFQDATVAAGPGGQPSGYDEPEIGHDKSKRPTDRDARTVAGVTSDFIDSGLQVPENGVYDDVSGIDLDISTKESPQPEKPSPKPKRGGRGLGQIKLEKREIRGESTGPFSDASEEMTEAGSASDYDLAEPAITSPPPAAAAKRTGPTPVAPKARRDRDVEKSINELFDDALASLPQGRGANAEALAKISSERLKPVVPQPLSDSFDGLGFEDSLPPMPPPSGLRGPSLLQPKVPPPLMPPPGQSGPMNQIGSTNVPPASLSLSEMLSMPVTNPPRPMGFGPASRGSRPGEIVPNTPSTAHKPRLSSMPNRQIRETVRAAGAADQVPTETPLPPANAFHDYVAAPMHTASPSATPSDFANPSYEPVRQRRSQKLLLLLAIIFGSFLVGGAGFLLYQQLFPRDPQLTVKTVPDGAAIYLNGQIQPAKTPATLGGLKLGIQYELKLVKEGYETQQKTVLIPPSTRTRNILVQIQMRKAVQATAHDAATPRSP